ncbi:MAG: TlpA disulfide reductase family protein [Desulfobacterales bacterium]
MAHGKFSILLTISLLILAGCTRASSTLPTAPTTHLGPSLAELVLPAPADLDQRHYLGLETKDAFRLDEIRTNVLIIEVFNFYCPHCQREAPSVNQLYRQIAADPNLKDRIKLIGIGVSNTPYEVDRFRKEYNVPFPLFPDRDRHLALQLNVRQTPTFIGFVIESDRPPRQFLHAPGTMGGADQFLARIIRLAELNEPPS